MRTEQDRKGPYYWGVLKDGTVRLFQSPPRARKFVVELTEDVDFYGQDKWHFLTTNEGKACDFNSRCGFDRGPKFKHIIKSLLK